MESYISANDRELLIRIDERMSTLTQTVNELKDDLLIFKATVVTKAELDARLYLNDTITYGFAGLILVAVIGAMISRVVKRK